MLFPYLLKVSLLLGVLTLGYRWMVQFETYSKFNRLLLWLNVLAAWSLPLIPLPNWGPTRIQAEFHQSIPKIAQAAPAVKHKIAAYNPAPTVVSHQRLSSLNQKLKSLHVMQWLLVVYISGVLVLASHFFYQVGGLVWVLLRSPKEKSDRRVVFVRNLRSNSPYSFFQWIIVNPEKHQPGELQHIIAHETEHALQWHSLDLLLAELQRIVLWFNPFAWFHQKLVQANLEYLADRAVLDGGFERKQYQYSLLNAILCTTEVPLTTSFAQSLLKNRIKMMNKKPSHYLAWGKYALLLAVLYVSSAFVAPYTLTLVKLPPSILRPALKTLATNDKVNFKEVSSKILSLGPSKAESLIEELKKKTPETTKAIQPSRSKWVIKKNDALFWVISPLATLDDINEIRNEVKSFDAELNINSIEYDPLQSFIARITVHVNVKSGSSSTAKEGTDRYSPMKGESGYLTKSGSLGTGSVPNELEKQLQMDYEKALALSKKNEPYYFETRLMEKITALGSSSSHAFDKNTLNGAAAESAFRYDGVGKSTDNFLKLEPEHRNSELYLNSKPATFTELNSLSFDLVRSIKIIRDARGKKYMIVYTN
ncbi:M56 family metallopeptidase [Dyadobacter arcticus]|uniref:Beta-lactamase regulating signal transducer with metallopeptidase domain n=1 Tax=Dyadobacter arcticus TaxID=1078754 RepID=A0ABX0UFX1_9BACT|nr:M56 family metallopeptidase [Dyadobacter arcticus]NIJ51903.1 beta-lactamase regulating signal transducer with metallopeptidase domain [Dyadobacter arcticus]